MSNPFSKTAINNNEPFGKQQELRDVLTLEARSGFNNVLLELTSNESNNVFQKEEQMVGIGRTRFKSPP